MKFLSPSNSLGSIRTKTPSDSECLKCYARDPSRLQTQVELIRSKSVLEYAAKSLKLPSVEELEDALEVELIRDTQIVEKRIDHPRPEDASAWANAVAQGYIDYRRDRAIEQAVAAQEDFTRRINEVKAQIAEKDGVLADLQGAAQELQARRDQRRFTRASAGPSS